jgi:hypothetical protein
MPLYDRPGNGLAAAGDVPFTWPDFRKVAALIYAGTGNDFSRELNGSVARFFSLEANSEGKRSFKNAGQTASRRKHGDLK